MPRGIRGSGSQSRGQGQNKGHWLTTPQLTKLKRHAEQMLTIVGGTSGRSNTARSTGMGRTQAKRTTTSTRQRKAATG